jgi:hypothetical protein
MEQEENRMFHEEIEALVPRGLARTLATESYLEDREEALLWLHTELGTFFGSADTEKPRQSAAACYLGLLSGFARPSGLPTVYIAREANDMSETLVDAWFYSLNHALAQKRDEDTLILTEKYLTPSPGLTVNDEEIPRSGSVAILYREMHDFLDDTQTSRLVASFAENIKRMMEQYGNRILLPYGIILSKQAPGGYHARYIRLRTDQKTKSHQGRYTRFEP